MGCKAAKPESFSIEEEYRKRNLPMPDVTIFENGFEKEAFFTANVIRADPKSLIPFIKEVKGKPYYIQIGFFNYP